MHPLRELSPDALRTRTSVKWRQFAPDVLPLFVAEMDVPLAPPVRAALERAVAAGDTGYPTEGEYVAAFAEFAADCWGLAAAGLPALEVADVMTGVCETLRRVTPAADAVVVNPPVYPPFFDAVSMTGRRVVECPLGADGRLDLDALAETFERVRPAAYLLCSPHNPTAVIHSADELRQVAGLAREFGVRVVVDEIHAPLAGPDFVPYLSVDGTEDAYAIWSASKAFNLAGIKAAVIVGGAATAEEVTAVPTLVRHGPSHLGIIAHVAALEEARDWLDALRADLAANRELLHRLVAEHVPDGRLLAGPGTYTAWLDLRAYDLPTDAAEYLFEHARVAFTPGPDFGATVGEGCVRVTYGSPPELLTEAIERTGRALGAFRASR